ncbi:MAG: ankyrin repeat domain-containing protein [Candidatus Riflebacteria bacterium]|nr:ankyrin repeat domain-containing protein [Candidatus Riflebacteria bacterium]
MQKSIKGLLGLLFCLFLCLGVVDDVCRAEPSGIQLVDSDADAARERDEVRCAEERRVLEERRLEADQNSQTTTCKQDKQSDGTPNPSNPTSPIGSSTNLFPLIDTFDNPETQAKFKKLLADGADPNQRNETGELLLNYATCLAGKSQYSPPGDVRPGRYDHILLFLQAGADVRKSGSSGTPLHAAARQGDVDLTLLYLEKGADVNSRDEQGNTPLLVAIPFGKEVFNLLLHRGADREAVNKNRQSAFDLALYFRSFDFMDLLIRHGAPINPMITRIRKELKLGTNPVLERIITRLEALHTHILPPPPPASASLVSPKADPPLIVAIRKHQTEEVRKLLQAGCDPNTLSATFNPKVHDFREATNYGAPGLILALHQNFYDLAELLVTHGANVNLHGAVNDYDDNNLPLLLAVRDEKMTRFLLDHGATVDLPSIRFGETALMVATQTAVMNLLLERGADIQHHSRHGTVLTDAVDKKLPTKVAFLLDHGARINEQIEDDGSTALHHAVTQADTALVRLLLERGADPTLKNDTGLNPYDLARTAKKPELTTLFKTGGGVPPASLASHPVQPKENTARLIQEAIIQNNSELLQTLLTEGADPDGDPQWPYLIQAVSSGRESGPLVRILVEHGAKVGVTDSNKRGLLHFIQDPQLIALIVSKGADPKASDSRGVTPLHLAAAAGRVDWVQCLMIFGAQANVVDEIGRTPLHEAASGPPDQQPADGPPPDWTLIPGYLETITLLSKAGASVKTVDQYGKTPLDIAKDRREAQMEPIRKLLESLP